MCKGNPKGNPLQQESIMQKLNVQGWMPGQKISTCKRTMLHATSHVPATQEEHVKLTMLHVTKRLSENTIFRIYAEKNTIPLKGSA